MPEKFPFPTTPELIAVAIAYQNRSMIADDVLPRVSVGREEFKYWEFPKEEGFTVPDTRVGRKSQPNQVEFSATEKTSSTEDYGLDDAIPQKDIDEAPQGLDPRARATEQLTNLILLDREVRVAGIVFDPATYSAGLKEVLAAGNKFSDAASKPLTIIGDALDVPLVRPNVMVIGQKAWTALRRHPQIVEAVLGTAAKEGMASRQAVAELLELEEILVGESFVNTARKGKPGVFARTWGPNAALIHRNRQADTRNGLTFGYTAQRGTRIAGAIEDRDIGLRGGVRVRVGEQVKEVISAPDAAYFIEAAA